MDRPDFISSPDGIDAHRIETAHVPEVRTHSRGWAIAQHLQAQRDAELTQQIETARAKRKHRNDVTTFWILVIAYGLVCLVGGYFVGRH